MGKCCGGKNAGKPISLPRYLAGLGIFCTYHSTVAVMLKVAARPIPHLRPVRDFHSQLFRDELKEILAREDINLQSRVLKQEDEFCAIDEGGLPMDFDEVSRDASSSSVSAA